MLCVRLNGGRVVPHTHARALFVAAVQSDAGAVIGAGTSIFAVSLPYICLGTGTGAVACAGHVSRMHAPVATRSSSMIGVRVRVRLLCLPFILFLSAGNKGLQVRHQCPAVFRCT